MIDTKGLDDFRSEWKRLNDQEEAAKVTATKAADVDVDDFDDGEKVKDIAKVAEPETAPVVESKTDDSDKSAVQATPAVEPAKLSFKQAFAAARKAGDKTFEWEGKKFAAKLKGEVNKPVQTAKAAPAKAAEDDHTAAWNDDGSADKKEMARLTSQPQVSRTKSIVDALVPDSWIPPRFKNNGETETKVAKVSSPVKTSSPMRSTPDVKTADSHKAITDKMGVDQNTLLPKPEARIAANGKGNQG